MIAVPTGDRKMAESPAAMPVNSSRRRSRSLRPVALAYHEPTAAVMSAIGPSRPADPPDPMVMAEAMSLTGATRVLRAPPA